MNRQADQKSLYQKLIRLMMQAKRQMFIVVEEMKLTPVQGMLIVSLQPDEQRTMHDLAMRMGCDASNITGLIDRLEAQNLIKRIQDPKDRRVKKICLSEHGLSCRQAIIDKLHQSEALHVASLSQAEQEQLQQLLDKLLDLN